MITTLVGSRPADSHFQRVMEEIRDLEPEARVKRLDLEVAAAVKAQELALVESISFQYGNGSSSIYGPDPQSEDNEIWDEVGIRGATRLTSQPQMRTLEDLRRARDVCRDLAAENEYAIGAHNTQVNYLVGKGLRWRFVPKEPKNEDKDLTAQMVTLSRRIAKEVLGPEREGETVWRGNRDGEALLRIYPSATDLPKLRFVEPEYLRPPGADRTVAPWGVEKVGGEPVAYWILEAGDLEPTRVPAKHLGLDVRQGKSGIPQVIHWKLNTDSSCDRGWPTMFPIRRPLARAEKLQANRSFVKAAQAAIMLIRKHDTATASQVTAMLDRAASATASNTATGQTTRYIEMKRGTIVDAPKGTHYESPISNANANDGSEVHSADLRAAAVRCNMPEYLFTGDSSGAAYSSQLVAESPFVKSVERAQVQVGHPLIAVVEAVVIHEEFMGRLPSGAFDAYEIQVEYPSPIVRDQLQKAQEVQILSSMGVVSRLTTRQQWGLDDTTEERNLDLERARGYLDLRGNAPGANNAGKPPAGATPGGPGGLDNQKSADSAPNGRPPADPAGDPNATNDAPVDPTELVPGAAPAAGAPTVQDTALNGAQVSSMIELVQAVADGKLPAAAAIQMLVLAFPSVGLERATSIISAAAAFDPKPDPTPPPLGGPPASTPPSGAKGSDKAPPQDVGTPAR